MQNSHAGTIKGLSIATIVLSVLSILGLLFCLLFLGVGGVALNDPTLQDSVSMSIEADPETVMQMEDLGLTTDDTLGLVGIVFGLGAAYVIWGVICCIISLVAGIIGLRNCRNTAKLGGAFGWAIAGAVTSFLYGNIVVMVLLIISAVCISKDRKASTAIPYGQPAAYTQTPGQQGYYAPQPQQPAPQQPYGQPQQPAQFQQPTQPDQGNQQQ